MTTDFDNEIMDWTNEHSLNIARRTKKYSPRELVFFEIINERNRNKEQGSAPELYDCGVLGICRVYWHRGWECEWFDVPLRKIIL